MYPMARAFHNHELLARQLWKDLLIAFEVVLQTFLADEVIHVLALVAQALIKVGNAAEVLVNSVNIGQPTEIFLP